MPDKPSYAGGNLQACHAALQNKLRRALVRCETKYGISAEQSFQKLTAIPTIWLLPQQPIEMGEITNRNDQAMLIRADQKRWTEIENARWSDLSKKDKRAAKKLTSFLGKGRSHRRQRPNTINYTLALFLIFTLEEILHRPVPFSRPPSSGLPRGPAFDALLAALTLAQWRVAIRAETSPGTPTPSALESILKVTRGKRFKDLLHIQGLSRSPMFAAVMSHSLALTIGVARSRRQVKRIRGTN